MSSPASTETIVSIKNLTRTFNDKIALNKVNLEVNKGQVFGIVGENGAGKTTLIKHMLGLYKAQSGSVAMFNKNPVLDPPAVLSNIGYLSEEPDLPAWMSISEILYYSASFYPNWDPQYADKLIDTFELPRSKKIKELSKGQRARIGLVLAQAHRPELLLLDEPSSGLDPIVRKDILGAIISGVMEEGRSVIFSSHLLEEVERVCDYLVMLHKGHILLSGALDDIIADHHIFTVKYAGPTESPLNLAKCHKITNLGPEIRIECAGKLETLKQSFCQLSADIIHHRTMTLDEIFTARTEDPQFSLGAF